MGTTSSTSSPLFSVFCSPTPLENGRVVEVRGQITRFHAPSSSSTRRRRLHSSARMQRTTRTRRRARAEKDKGGGHRPAGRRAGGGSHRAGRVASVCGEGGGRRVRAGHAPSSELDSIERLGQQNNNILDLGETTAWATQTDL
uniref:Uncharacterized protein n=1 Tax=Oryza sativa subsp. japonica TaxID=39947 RepID=Q84SN1_ORYSJ|nr:hypothetical protein [Oryza sativa Japonica Group]